MVLKHTVLVYVHPEVSDETRVVHQIVAVWIFDQIFVVELISAWFYQKLLCRMDKYMFLTVVLTMLS